jgi:hypothetical protein
LRTARRALRTRRKALRHALRARVERGRQLARSPRVRLADRRQNRRLATADERFLALRHWSNPGAFDPLLAWLAEHAPEVRARFELHLLPWRTPDWSRARLHLPWLQDPVQAWSARAYARALELGAECAARGIPVINPVERLANAEKSEGARRMRVAGLRTPRMEPIRDAAEFAETGLGLPLPLFVREDAGHGGPLLRADTPEQLRRLPVGMFSRPVAVELIDVRDPRDGLHRKHRYLAAGEVGVALALHASQRWVTRGTRPVFSPDLVQEELAYTGAPDPHHADFQRARAALELDVVAFDYGYDRDGRMVVWEANPFPWIDRPGGRRAYREPAYARAFAAIARLYLTRAGLPVPARIEAALARDQARAGGPQL